jgi:hypothetical protein
VTIPNSVTNIEQDAFASCGNLSSVTLGKNVTTIGEQAFASCSRLNTITCLSITAPTMGMNAFNHISNNGTLIIPLINRNYETFLVTSSLISMGWTVVEQ